MIMYFLTLLFYLILNTSFAQPLSLSTALKERESHQTERALDYLCRRQIEKRKIPEACYQAKGRYLSNKEIWKSFIDEKCFDLSANDIQKELILKSLNKLKVSQPCLDFLSEENEILKLQSRDSSIIEVMRILK